MKTDIVLRSPGRTIIIDTKFYRSPLDTRFDGRRVHSGNLYQIFAYVTNWAAAGPADEPEPEGWLLYAAVDGDFDYRFKLMGRRIRVCSIDLAQEWRAIEGDLKGLVDAEREWRESLLGDASREKAGAIVLRRSRKVQTAPAIGSDGETG